MFNKQLFIEETAQERTNMSRRGGPGVKLVGFVAAGAFLVFGLYSYHDVHTRLRKSEEKTERLRNQHDSISAQLQVVYEHKSKLEKSLSLEKADHKKTRESDDSQKEALERRCTEKEEELSQRIASINQEKNMLESQNDDFKTEMAKLQNELDMANDNNKNAMDRNKEEYLQLKQECENEEAKYRDQIADLERKAEKYLSVITEYQETEQQNKILYQQIQLQNADIQSQLDDSRKQQGLLNKAIQDQKVANEKAAFNVNPPDVNVMNQKPDAGGVKLKETVLDLDQKDLNLNQDQGDDKEKHADDDDVKKMQINMPGENEEHKGYFEVKDAQNEGEGNVHLDAGDENAAREEGGVHKQVAAPDLDNNKLNEGKANVIGGGAHPANPSPPGDIHAELDKPGTNKAIMAADGVNKGGNMLAMLLAPPAEDADEKRAKIDDNTGANGMKGSKDIGDFNIGGLKPPLAENADGPEVANILAPPAENAGEKDTKLDFNAPKKGGKSNQDIVDNIGGLKPPLAENVDNEDMKMNQENDKDMEKNAHFELNPNGNAKPLVGAFGKIADDINNEVGRQNMGHQVQAPGIPKRGTDSVKRGKTDHRFELGKNLHKEQVLNDANFANGMNDIKRFKADALIKNKGKPPKNIDKNLVNEFHHRNNREEVMHNKDHFPLDKDDSRRMNLDDEINHFQGVNRDLQFKMGRKRNDYGDDDEDNDAVFIRHRDM